MERRDLIKRWMAWKSERENGNYTFKALAEDAGLNANYLSNVMTGIRNPGIQTLTKIAEALGVTLAEFYAGPQADGISLPQSENKDSNVAAVSDSPKESHRSLSFVAPELKSSSKNDIDTADGKTEKFGLKFSSEGHDSFDRLFSSFGFKESDFISEDGGESQFDRRRIDDDALHEISAPVGTAEEAPDDVISDTITIQDELFETPSFDRKPVNFETPAGNDYGQVRMHEDVAAENSYSSPVEDSIDDVPLLPVDFRGDVGLWLTRSASDGSEATFVKRRLSVDGTRIFAVSVADDSMAPDLAKGDLLYVDPDARYSASEGRIAFVMTDNGYLIRRIFGLGAGVFHLIPSNSHYAPNIVAKADVDVMKIVFWLPLRDDMFLS